MDSRRISLLRDLVSLTLVVSLSVGPSSASASGQASPRGVETACSFEETYRNSSITLLSTDCSLSREETLQALGSVVVGGALASGVDNIIAKVLGTGSKRILGWVSVFADLQTGNDFVQNPLRVFPVAQGLKRSSPTLKTVLFPGLRKWEAPLSEQSKTVGVVLAVDFLASPFSRHYWHEDWPISIHIEHKNQPIESQVLMSASEVERHIRTDRTHVLLLGARDALPVRKILAGCSQTSEECGVAVTLVSGDPQRLGVYRSYAELELVDD